MGEKSEKKRKQKPKGGRIRKKEKRKGKMERKGVRSEKKSLMLRVTGERIKTLEGKATCRLQRVTTKNVSRGESDQRPETRK